MGMQLIFVLETNKKCKSDWIYIKDTIEYFYNIDANNIKFTQVYMDGKGNFKNKQKEIFVRPSWVSIDAYLFRKSIFSYFKARSSEIRSPVAVASSMGR